MKKRNNFIDNIHNVIIKAGPFFVFFILSLCIFLFTDIFRINNETGRWIFLNRNNILNVLNQISMNAIIAFGMTFVILTAGIDLSVGSIVAAGGVLLSILFVDFNMTFIAALIVVVIAGFAIGIVNGFIIAKWKMPPFIITLATMTIFRGLALIMVDGRAKFIVEPEFKMIGNGFVGPIPVPIIILAICFVFLTLLLTRTTFGRSVYIMGGNEEAAILSGINTVKIKCLVYMIVGGCAGLSGVVLASRLGSGSPNVGVSYELDAIAAVIVGGTSLSGGIGTIAGTLAGALIIGVINNGMNIIGLSPYIQYIIKGMVILGVVIIDRKSHH